MLSDRPYDGPVCWNKPGTSPFPSRFEIGEVNGEWQIATFPDRLPDSTITDHSVGRRPPEPNRQERRSRKTQVPQRKGFRPGK